MVIAEYAPLQTLHILHESTLKGLNYWKALKRALGLLSNCLHILPDWKILQKSKALFLSSARVRVVLDSSPLPELSFRDCCMYFGYDNSSHICDLYSKYCLITKKLNHDNILASNKRKAASLSGY